MNPQLMQLMQFIQQRMSGRNPWAFSGMPRQMAPQPAMSAPQPSAPNNPYTPGGYGASSFDATTAANANPSSGWGYNAGQSFGGTGAGSGLVPGQFNAAGYGPNPNNPAPTPAPMQSATQPSDYTQSLPSLRSVRRPPAFQAPASSPVNSVNDMAGWGGSPGMPGYQPPSSAAPAPAASPTPRPRSLGQPLPSASPEPAPPSMPDQSSRPGTGRDLLMSGYQRNSSPWANRRATY